jgi:putative toxin-antitoxin system antitoxin component (TIGR02293 family)
VKQNRKKEEDTTPLYEILQKPAQIVREPVAEYLVRRVRAGLPLDEFHALREILGLSEEALASALGMSRTTLHRRKKSGRLDSGESERVIRLTRLFTRAGAVLGSQDAARHWLKSPARALGGETPISYSDTEIGAREVEDLLGRIEQGVFS